MQSERGIDPPRDRRRGAPFVLPRRAGIATDRWTYPQTALTFNLGHSRPHHDTSTEFHTETGPFTLVPLPGQRSSLVFVVDPALTPHPRGASERGHGGRDRAPLAFDPRQDRGRARSRRLPAGGRDRARHSALGRVVLIGEAAHVIPPIGAQGLNLGLRDAATIAELVVAAHRDGDDVGRSDMTRRYEHMRRADVTSRTLAVDLLNRSLLLDFLPLQGARGFGLFLMERIGPLRRAVMREGVMPAASQPRLMRGEAL